MGCSFAYCLPSGSISIEPHVTLNANPINLTVLCLLKLNQCTALMFDPAGVMNLFYHFIFIEV